MGGDPQCVVGTVGNEADRVRSGNTSLRLGYGESVTGFTAAHTFTYGVGRTPEIADVVVLSPTDLLINGKAVGTTSLVIWNEQGGISHFSLTVIPDTLGLQRQLRALFPDDRSKSRLQALPWYSEEKWPTKLSMTKSSI